MICRNVRLMPTKAMRATPAGLALMAQAGGLNWAFETVPQPGLGGRCGFAPRGKVMGGSSSLNAMVYTRGNAYDYDRWAAQGNPGWSYRDVLPLFKQSENNQCFGATDLRGALAHLGLLDRIPLTPEGVSIEEAVRGIDIAIDIGLPVLVPGSLTRYAVPITPQSSGGMTLVVAAADWWAVSADRRQLEYVLKPLTMVVLIAAALLNIFLQLFNLIFWWLPMLKICIPIPKAKE